jgi:hypothetical protein
VRSPSTPTSGGSATPSRRLRVDARQSTPGSSTCGSSRSGAAGAARDHAEGDRGLDRAAADAGIGDPTILKTLAVLQAILKRAVVDGELAPTRSARSTSRASAARATRADRPVYVERIRGWLLERGRSATRR